MSELTTLPTATPKPPETPPSKPTLLTLPAEIRNQIYTLLLTHHSIPHLRLLFAANQSSTPLLPPLPLTATLVRTCQQINTEATPILYGRNTFSASPTLLTGLPYLVNPTRPICNPNAVKRIKRWHVRVRIDCDARFNEADVTAAFTGAEELEVEAAQAMFRAAGSGVLRLFRGVRGVGVAKVGGSVEDDFARWLEGSMMAPVGEEVEAFDDGVERRVCGSLSQLYDVWLHGNR